MAVHLDTVSPSTSQNVSPDPVIDNRSVSSDQAGSQNVTPDLANDTRTASSVQVGVDGAAGAIPNSNANPVRVAVDGVTQALGSESYDRADRINKIVDGLSPEDTRHVFNTLDARGYLDDVAREINGGFHSDGLSYGEKTDFMRSVAEGLDADGILAFSDAIQEADTSAPSFEYYQLNEQLAEAVGAHAKTDTKLDLVHRLASRSWDGSPSPDAQFTSEIIQSLHGADAQAAFSSLSDSQLESVIDASTIKNAVGARVFFGEPGLDTPGGRMADFNGVMQAAASIDGAEGLKAEVFRLGTERLEAGPINRVHGGDLDPYRVGGLQGLSDLLTSDADKIIGALSDIPVGEDDTHLRDFAAMSIRHGQLDALNQVTAALTLQTTPAEVGVNGVAVHNSEMAARGFFAASVVNGINDEQSWRESRAEIAGEIFDAAASFAPGPSSKLLKLGYNEARDQIRATFTQAAEKAGQTTDLKGLRDAFYIALGPVDANGAPAYGSPALGLFNSSYDAALIHTTQ